MKADENYEPPMPFNEYDEKFKRRNKKRKPLIDVSAQDSSDIDSDQIDDTDSYDDESNDETVNQHRKSDSNHYRDSINPPYKSVFVVEEFKEQDSNQLTETEDNGTKNRNAIR